MKIILVVTYLSVAGEVSVETHPMPSMTNCVESAKKLVNNVKVGKVSTVCWSVK
jgi:hypothetical protein